jgi:hypothetical protein
MQCSTSMGLWTGCGIGPDREPSVRQHDLGGKGKQVTPRSDHFVRASSGGGRKWPIQTVRFCSFESWLR